MNLEGISIWKRIFQWKSVCAEIQKEFDSIRFQKEAHEARAEHHKEQAEAHMAELEKAKAGNRTALKFIMQTNNLRLKLAILFLSITLPCMAAFPPSYVHNNLDTNIVGAAPANGWFLVSTSSVPKWSINGGALTNLAGVAVAQGTNILTTTNGSVVTVNGLTDTNVVNILASNTTPSIVQGTNIVLTTNNHAVTVNGLTDTNVVNILLGAVTNGAILNLSNNIATKQIDSLNTANSVVVEEFPTSSANSLTIGTHGWRSQNSAGGSVAMGAGVANHPGVINIATGTVSGEGALICLGTTNSTTVNTYPSLSAITGWTNIWVFQLSATNDMVMYLGMVNNLVFLSTEPADWIGLKVDSTSLNAYQYVSRTGGSSTTANGPALDTATWHTFRMWSTVSGTVNCTLDAGGVNPLAAIPNVTLAAMAMVRKSAINNTVTLKLDYYSFIMTGLSR